MNGNVLIVEDEYIIASEIKMILEGAGITVIDIATSGETALAIVREKNVDLIVMDIKLAGRLDGIQTTELIRRYRDIPVIYLTSYADKTLVERAAQTAASGYILKPYNPQEVQSSVMIALSRAAFERELHDYQQWVATILSNINDAIIVYDYNKTITFMNQQAENLFDFTISDAKAEKPAGLIHLFNWQTKEPLDIFDEFQQTSGDSLLDQKRRAYFLSGNGDRVDIEFSLASLAGEKPHQRGIIVVFRNITRSVKIERDLAVAVRDKNQATEELVKAELKINSILAGVPIGTILLDGEKREILLINSRAREFLKNAKIIITYDSIYDALVKPNHSQQEQSKRYSLTVDDSTLGYTLYRIGDLYLCIYIRDITEDMLQDSISVNTHLTNDVNLIFSSIRHEIGNPLSILKTTLMVLEENFENFAAERRKTYFNRLKTAVGTMEDLLSQLKTYHLYNDMPLSDIDLVPLFREFCDQFQDHLQIGSVRFSLKFSQSSLMVRANRLGLQQVTINLIKNALDSFENIEHQPEIVLAAAINRKRIVIKLQDNGCGISSDDLSRVFTPLYTKKKHGSGLGLSIVKKIVTLMNGSIDLKSSLGSGTEVTITLDSAAG